MTQLEYLLKHFRSGNSITTLQAHMEGITSLPKRMCEIKHLLELRGSRQKVIKTWKSVKTRYGNGKVRVVEYRIG